jgi:hypothetical protein
VALDGLHELEPIEEALDVVEAIGLDDQLGRRVVAGDPYQVRASAYVASYTALTWAQAARAQPPLPRASGAGP